MVFCDRHVKQDTEVKSDADHAFYIQANSVKWTLLISGWAFRSMSNRLKLTVIDSYRLASIQRWLITLAHLDQV